MAKKPTYKELIKRVQELETDYTQLEKKLRGIESFSEEIMMHMSEGLILTDTRGIVIFINQRLSEMLGFSPEEVLNKCWMDMVPAEQQVIAHEAEDRRAQGFTDRYEIVLQHKDGHEFPVLIGAGPRFDKQRGQYIGSLGVVTDITERRLTEKALQEKTNFLHSIIDITSDLVSLTDMEGNLKFIGPSRRFLGYGLDSSHKVLGYDPDSFLGRNAMEFIHPDDYQDAAVAFAELLTNKEDGQKVEYRYRMPDGEYVWLETVGKFILDDAGNPKEILFCSRDLTARKQVEFEIKKTRDQYQSLVNNVSGVIYRCKLDKDWTMTFISDKVETLTGYPASDFIGNGVRTYESIIYPADKDSVVQSIHSASSEGRPWDIEYRIHHKEGSIRWVQEKGGKVPCEDGTVASLDGFILDITDRKLLEDEIVKRDHKILSENIKLKQRLKNQLPEGTIIGKSRQVQVLLAKIAQAAETDVAVLIEGESGTGKELVARRIHSMSMRKDNAFMPVNCGGIPENLAESLLFGHKKGAFTGAYDDHLGYIQKANNGTLFLDEVNSLPVSIQAKFLRVLEDRQVTPVGSNIPVKINFRLICASNQNIQEAVMDKTIRSDFYYRINIIAIPIPPLRDRLDDIPILAEHFMKKYQAAYHDGMNLEITNDVLKRLKTYSFPGNIRELKNILYRYFTIGTLDIDEWKGPEPSEPKRIEPEKNNTPKNDVLNFFDKNVPLKEITENIEKAYISQLLIQEKYNKSNVADILGIGRKTLYLKIQKYNL